MNTMNLAIKQTLLGNSIGALLMRSRNALERILIAYKMPEQSGCIANDQIASFLLTRLCESGKVFIDVGSHIGSVIADVEHNNPSARIVGIEADPDKADRLRKKFRHIIHNCAAGNETGSISFFIDTKRPGYSSLLRPSSISHIKDINVKIKRLDDLVFPDDIDVIKIDVEGAELGVIMGSANIISKSRPVIMFESAPGNNVMGFTKSDMWDCLNELGYTIHIPNRIAHNDDGLSKDGFLDSHVYPRRTTNYFAIPGERRIEIRDKARKILVINS